MRHRDFEASIQCEKKTLEEYSVDVEGPGKITSWVPSEVGKTFTIHIADLRTQSPSSYQTKVYVDGVRVASKCRGPGKQQTTMTVHTAGNKTAPLLFSPLMTSDSTDPLLNNPLLAELGTIKIDVNRTTGFSAVDWHDDDQRRVSDILKESQKGVHEQLKSLLDQRVSLGESKTARLVVHTPNGYIDRDGEPYVHFVFRYRPRSLLKAMGHIAPSTTARSQASSGSKGSKRPNADLNTPSSSRRAKRRRTHARSRPSDSDVQRVEMNVAEADELNECSEVDQLNESSSQSPTPQVDERSASQSRESKSGILDQVNTSTASQAETSPQRQASQSSYNPIEATVPDAAIVSAARQLMNSLKGQMKVVTTQMTDITAQMKDIKEQMRILERITDGKVKREAVDDMIDLTLDD